MNLSSNPRASEAVAPAGPTAAPGPTALPGDWLTPAEREAALSRSVPIALAILCGDYAIYLSLVTLTVSRIPLAASLALTVVSGLFIGNIFTVGHDGAHQSLTEHKGVNRWMARFAFLPAMHSVPLWVVSHNHVHHAFTNLRGKDYVWEPMSPADWAAATPMRRARYRLYRSPFGSFPYYIYEFWIKRNFLPVAPEVRGEWPRYMFDAAFIVVGNAALMALVVGVGHRLAPERPLLLTWTLGWLLPFLWWNWIMGWIIFMHHTHPEVGWYANRDEWTQYRGQVLATVQARLPPVMDTFSNNIMEHTAHHVLPNVPMYRLRRVQRILRDGNPRVKALMLTPASFVRHARACKLFDYERRQWVDYDGTPTGPVIPLDGA